MSVFVAHGWGTKQGTVAVRGGRAVIVGWGGWSISNRWPAYPGFDGYTNGGTEFQADSRRTTQAIIKWLTGKTTGANILAVTDEDWTPPDLNHGYGTEFHDAVEAYGHTITATGTYASWAGFEPLDYDCTFMGSSLTLFSYHGLLTAQEKVDYVLGNGGAICGHIAAGTNVWAAYGFPLKGNHADNFSGADHGYRIHYISQGPYSEHNDGWTDQHPFVCDEFGDPGQGGSWNTHYYALVTPTTNTAFSLNGTNSRGGTKVAIECAVPEDKNPYEDHYYATGNVGTIGLWWNG